MYYHQYEMRYRAVYAAGAQRWGYSPDDEELTAALEAWVGKHGLSGRKIMEFACGEGAGGVILSRLNCVYHGVDLAPSALEKAKEALREYPAATVEQLDMVRDAVPYQEYDGAFDSMGLHMLVTDEHRQAYLNHVFDCLKPGAPAFFFSESYREDAYSGPVDSLADWQRITGLDFDTPEERRMAGTDQTVCLPLLPARPKNRQDYMAEMECAGFVVDDFVVLGENGKCPYAASIYVHKP